MSIKKAKKAYYRKLYIAHLIASERHSLLSLEATTGMHKRTLQTAMAGLGDIGIDHQFIQEGVKNNHGYYVITDWGDHNPQWIANHLDHITTLLVESVTHTNA